MLLPIYAYGQPVLKKMGENITPEYTDLQNLIADMWETMYHAQGVGLAAPQIGLAIRLFVIDTLQVKKDEEEDAKESGEAPKTDAPQWEGIKQVFINAQKIEETGKIWSYEEGCLSVPKMRGDVERPSVIRLRYLDENFVEHEGTFDGLNGRVIQHEYDHIDGILFTDHFKPLKKRLIQRKLDNIRTGKIETEYKMRFVKLK
jgi:peptide deformylase